MITEFKSISNVDLENFNQEWAIFTRKMLRMPKRSKEGPLIAELRAEMMNEAKIVSVDGKLIQGYSVYNSGF